MLLRRATPLALALAALACEPSVPYDPAAHNPKAVDYAVFDPAPDSFDKSPADIPLPNDLAFQASAIATQPAAQAEVLTSFAAQGGWPADQTLPITFDFVRITLDPNTGASTRSAPPLDVASINPGNLIILSLSASGVSAVDYDTPVYTTVDAAGATMDHGTLIINKKADAAGLRHWAPAVYAAAIKGGSGGIKMTAADTVNPGGPVNPRPAMFLITQGQDLTRPENQGLIACDPPVPCSRADKAAKGAQLEQVRKAYLLPFTALAGAGFPTNQIADMTVFTVTSAVRVIADPDAAAVGQSALPFPSDFLLDPTTHHLIAAAQDPVHGPFGALGPPLGSLDGFSTTALMTANTSGLIDPTTVNKNTVFLYEYTATGPQRVPEAAELATGAKPGWAAASSALAAAAGLSTINVIALQPAIPVALPTGGAFPLPPLHEGSEYAVVITDGIAEPGGKHIVQATLGRLLALSNPLLVGTTPTVAGLTLANAQQLEPLREALSPVLDDIAANHGVTRDHVVMAYTIRTQSGIKTTAALLASLPYGTPSSGASSTLNPLASPTVSCSAATAANPACGTATVSAQFSAYGLDTAVTPASSIGYIVEAPVLTFSKLVCPTTFPPGNPTPDPTAAACAAFLTAANGGKNTGFFTPSNFNPQPTPINALIALPIPSTFTDTNGTAGCIPGPALAGGNSPNGVCTVPLVIFRHGLFDSRRAMLAIANELVKQGFAVAAIDAPLHGDRALCDAGKPGECASGASCVADPALSGEGDAPLPTPGHCQVGGTPADFARDTTTCPGCTNTKATPLVSGNFLFSLNLFRTRDSFRQDIIDQSQLIRLLSPNPVCDKTQPPTNTAVAGGTCANNIITAATGFQIDPKKIYFVGQSLGSMQGSIDAAANPRVSKVALNVAGGTIVDVVINGSYFAKIDALLALVGKDKETNPSGFLQFATIAKWVLDPAEPLNFAQNLATNTIPWGNATLDAIAPAPTTRPVIGQMALCDPTVPNPFNLELYKLIGLGPATASTGTLTTFIAGAGTACPANAVKHGFLLDWKTYGNATNFPNFNITLGGQDDIAKFFAATPTLPFLPPNVRSAN